MGSSKMSAVLFASNLEKVAKFYVHALEMPCKTFDEDHWLLNGHDFDLVIHQIPKQYLCEDTENQSPPKRRESAAIRLNFPIKNIEEARKSAKALGGQIDEPQSGAKHRNPTFFLGYDPEGNVIGINHEQG